MNLFQEPSHSAGLVNPRRKLKLNTLALVPDRLRQELDLKKAQEEAAKTPKNNPNEDDNVSFRSF